MNNVPAKLKKQWAFEDIMGMRRVCMRSSEGNCAGRITKEHAIIYAGKQLQEEWSILDICEYHHGVNNFQDRGDMKKEVHIWIALNRAPEERLRELNKGEDKLALRGRLNRKYGVYVGAPRLQEEVINY